MGRARVSMISRDEAHLRERAAGQYYLSCAKSIKGTDEYVDKNGQFNNMKKIDPDG